MHACTYTSTYTCMGTCTCMETQARTQTYTYTDIQIQAHACRHRVGVGLKRQRSVTVRKYVWRSAAVSALCLYSSRRCSKAWVRAGFCAPLDLEYATCVKQGPIVTISDSASVTLNLKNTCSDTLHSHPCLQLHLLWSCRPHPPLLKLLCVTSYFPSCCGTGGTAHDVALLQTATRVDNQIISDIMLNIIIVVVIFITSTINRIAATIPLQPS